MTDYPSEVKKEDIDLGGGIVLHIAVNDMSLIPGRSPDIAIKLVFLTKGFMMHKTPIFINSPQIAETISMKIIEYEEEVKKYKENRKTSQAKKPK